MTALTILAGETGRYDPRLIDAARRWAIAEAARANGAEPGAKPLIVPPIDLRAGDVPQRDVVADGQLVLAHAAVPLRRVQLDRIRQYLEAGQLTLTEIAVTRAAA